MSIYPFYSQPRQLERDNNRETPTQTKAWRDNRQQKEHQRSWLSLSSPQQPYGPPTRENNEMLVSELLLPSTYEWNREKIRALLPRLENTITDLKPSVLGAEDRLSWLGNPSY